MSGEASKTIAKEVLWGGGRSPFSVTYGKMMMWYFLVSDALTFSGLLTAYGMIRHTQGATSPWPIGEQVFFGFPGTDAHLPLLYVALMTFILIVSSVTMVLAVEAGHRNDKKSIIKWLALTVVGGFVFVGSQAWEWSHFIHGAGGCFTINEDIQVTNPNSGETYQLLEGDRIFMDHDFGHVAEGWVENEAGFSVNESGGSVVAMHVHGAHKDEAPLEKLTINKYVENQFDVTGADMMKLWNAQEDNSFIFGANLQVSEYAEQQAYSGFFFFITGFHGFHVFSGVIINLIVLLMVMRGVFDKRGHYEMVEKVGLYWHFVDLVWVFVFTFFYLI